MNKKTIVDEFIKQIERELATAKQAVKTAREDATNEESKPENEYDTRALEASYVARGQEKRVTELEEILYEFKHAKLKNFETNDPVAVTALVEAESEDGKNHWFLFMSKGGGLSLKIDGKAIQVVTGNSPFGEALLGMKIGDSFVVEIGYKEKEYEVIKIY